MSTRLTRRKATLSKVGVAVGLLVLVVAALYVQLTALTYNGLKDALRGQGASIQDEGAQSQLLPVRVLVGASYRLRINGTDVDVFEYQTALGAIYDASRISADGSSFRPSFVPFGGQPGSLDFFVAPPHWFRSGRVIVLYVGKQGDLLALLRTVLGAQVAGG